MIDILKDTFLYDPARPMIFTKGFFWGFFLVIFIGFSFIYKQKTLRNAYLFFISLFFYYKTGGLFLFILIFSTVTDFYLGKAIYQSAGATAKKILLAFSLVLNLSVLLFFKYDYFFTETVNNVFGTGFEVVTHSAKWSNSLLGTNFSIDRMLPPVGISFFTFQSISYVMDVYRGQVKPVDKITDYGFYISFFPQLVAGPIVRASEFIPQLYKPFELSQTAFGMAVFIILKGLFKKIFIGDYIAVNLIDRIFANPGSYTGFENLLGLYGYSLQVYCDFSGYTDIAIGLALLMGFTLPVNFNSPYKAENVGDFWKRWHMSLSSWLKDYLYIPMGGNRGGSYFTYISLFGVLAFIVLIAGKLWLVPLFLTLALAVALLMRLFPKLKQQVSTNINLMMTMLLGGLWHGASWMFVIWGGLNGLGLLVYKFWKKISPFRHNLKHPLVRFWGIFITFNFITFTRIWFRGESMKGTGDLLRQITTNFGWAEIPAMTSFYLNVLLVMLLGFILHWLPSSLKEKGISWFVTSPVYVKIGLSAMVVFIIYQSVSSDIQPFIYFQF